MTSLANHFTGWPHRPLNLLMKVLNAILISSGIVMALTFFMVVLLRYLFQADLFAYEEWLMMIAFWMFFSGSAIATHDRQHVTADMLGFMIKSPRLLLWRRLLVESLELLILLVLSWWGWLMIMESIEAYPRWQQTVALKLPFILPRSGIFIGLALMALYTALHLIVLVRELRTDSSSAQ